jgi:hypothetical protein
MTFGYSGQTGLSLYYYAKPPDLTASLQDLRGLRQVYSAQDSRSGRSRFSFPVGHFHPLQTCRFIPAHPVLDPAGLRRVGDSDPL